MWLQPQRRHLIIRAGKLVSKLEASTLPRPAEEEFRGVLRLVIMSSCRYAGGHIHLHAEP